MTKRNQEMDEAVGALALAVRNFRASAEEAVSCMREIPNEAKKSLTLRHWHLAPVVVLPAREG
jgi:hypothetical protein